jgi:hypothetical protein
MAPPSRSRRGLLAPRTPGGTPHLTAEDGLHAVRSPVEHGGREVGVYVGRGGQVRVTEDARHNAEILPGLDHQRGEGVP